MVIGLSEATGATRLPSRRTRLAFVTVLLGASMLAGEVKADEAVFFGQPFNARGERGPWLSPVTRPARGETVMTRPKPELDPLGLRLGSFLIFPQLSVQGLYDDNIFATEDDKEGDFIGRILPIVNVGSDWSRHEFRLTLGGDIKAYADNPDENRNNFESGAAVRLDVQDDSYLAGNVSYVSLSEDRSSPEPSDIISERPTRYNVFQSGIEYYKQFNRFDATANFQYIDFNFDDGEAVVDGMEVPINNDDRDRNVFPASLRLGYEVSPGIDTFVRGEYNFRNYDDTPDDAGFDRSSDGYSAVAGVSLDLGGLIFGDIFAGYESQSYDDSRLSDISGFDFGMDLTWNVTPLTTIQAGVSRTIEETTIVDASGFMRSAGSIGVDHELLRNLILNLDFTVANHDYEGIDRSDMLYRVRVGADYQLNRYANATASYTFRARDSDVEDASFNRNIFLVGLGVRY